jgi:hypothetical protein
MPPVAFPHPRAALFTALLLVLVWPIACGEPEARESAGGAHEEDAEEMRGAPPGEGIFEVVEMELGRRVGRNMRIADPTDSFDAGDPVYLVAVTDVGEPGARMVVRWRDAEGSVLYRSSEFVPPGRNFVEQRARLPQGWLPGSYTVEVDLNGDPAGSRPFRVVPPE